MQLLANRFVNTRSEEHEESDEHAEEAGIAAGTEEEESYTPINGYEPNDIRGSMTLEQIADLLGMPLDEMYARLGLASDYPANSTIKSAAESAGLGLGDFKHLLFE
jgi:hypothetical protein